MLPGIGFSYYYGSDDKQALVYSAAVTVFLGTLFFFLLFAGRPKHKKTGRLPDCDIKLGFYVHVWDVALFAQRDC